MELSHGALIAGRYRADRKIGAGGMGEVWAGENVAIGVKVALKTLLPAAALDRQLVARFRREAQLLGRLRSDRVARVVDFVEDRTFGLVLVMDFVEGEQLGSVLATRRLGVEEAIDVGVDILTALSDLHRAGVVHRDLKPDNVILEPLHGVDGRRRAVIVDLGVSRLLASPESEEVTSITQVDMAVGTLPYMAPEQLLSSSTVTGAADVYAVGAILFRCVSGEQVFGDEDDILAARHKISDEAPPLSLARVDRVARGFAAVVARALQRMPAQRFKSAEEMQAELVALQDLARAMSFDLDAATEEALPSMLALSVEPSAAPTWPMSRAPVMSANGAVVPSPVPVVYDDGIFDEATQLSPASLRLLGAASSAGGSAKKPFERTLDSSLGPPMPAPSEPPAASSLPSGSARPTRPTVLSPVTPDPPVVSVAVPPTLAAPPTVDEPPPSRTVSLRLALLGLIAALAAGTALGVEAHRLSQGAPRADPGARHVP